MQGAAPNPACTIQELSRAMRKNPTQAEKKTLAGIAMQKTRI